MRHLTLFLLFAFSLSWINSLSEKHLCDEDQTYATVVNSVQDEHPEAFANLGRSGSSEADHHEQEACHFGHCSHGQIPRLAKLQSVIAPSPARLKSPYHMLATTGVTRLLIKPPTA